MTSPVYICQSEVVCVHPYCEPWTPTPYSMLYHIQSWLLLCTFVNLRFYAFILIVSYKPLCHILSHTISNHDFFSVHLSIWRHMCSSLLRAMNFYAIFHAVPYRILTTSLYLCQFEVVSVHPDCKLQTSVPNSISYHIRSCLLLCRFVNLRSYAFILITSCRPLLQIPSDTISDHDLLWLDLFVWGCMSSSSTSGKPLRMFLMIIYLVMTSWIQIDNSTSCISLLIVSGKPLCHITLIPTS